MKNMVTLILLLFLLNISFLVSSLTDPRCFWRMKENKGPDGDAVNYCIFIITGIPNTKETDDINHGLEDG